MPRPYTHDAPAAGAHLRYLVGNRSFEVAGREVLAFGAGRARDIRAPGDTMFVLTTITSGEGSGV